MKGKTGHSTGMGAYRGFYRTAGWIPKPDGLISSTTGHLHSIRPKRRSSYSTCVAFQIMNYISIRKIENLDCFVIAARNNKFPIRTV